MARALFQLPLQPGVPGVGSMIPPGLNRRTPAAPPAQAAPASWRQAIFDAEPHCVKLLGRDGSLQAMNPAGLRLIEAEEFSQVAGKCVYPFVVAEHRAKFEALTARAFRGEAGTLEFELIGLKGARRWMETHSTPLRDPGGRIVAMLGITRDITARKHADEELQRLSLRLLQAQEIERRRIARELHDQVGQSLTALQLNLDGLQQSARGRADAQRWRECQRVLEGVLERVQSLSLALRPPLLDDLGLVAAVRAHLRDFRAHTGLRTRLQAGALPPDLDAEVANACFRILAEALTNVSRHARAASTSVELRLRGRRLELRVRDDGLGFDVAATRDGTHRGECLGLLGMEERAQLAGGWIEIDSAPGKFTEVRATFPIDKPRAVPHFSAR